MGLFDSAKSGKLMISGYSDVGRSKLLSKFEAMFNPASFSQAYSIDYTKQQALGTSGTQAKYVFNKPSQLKLKLILDDTGVMEMGIISLFGANKTIKDRVDEFLKTTYQLKGETHEPAYLKVVWGKQLTDFSCRLLSVDIAYVNFDSDGNAKRAELDIVFISDEDVEKRLAKDDLKSPDLTHSRVVKSGDTLPLMCKQVYGSSKYYIRVAEVNNLDNFRDLTPGQELIFPPLEK